MQCVLAAVVGVSTQIVLAGPQADMCTMTRTKNTRSAVAGSIISRACWKIYDNGNFLMAGEREYYGCLLQNLPGTEDDLNARRIADICGRQGLNTGR
jgi:hypothetical protein